MKLCLIAPVPPPYGGIANWTQMMLSELPACGVDVSVINTAPRKRTTEGRSLFDRVFVSGFSMLKQRKELRKLLKKDCPDVIHITTSGRLAVFRDILLLRVAKKNNVPTCYHIRFGRIPEICGQKTAEWRRLCMAIGLASTTVCIDNKTFSCLKNNLPECKSVLIPNPVIISDMPSSAVRKKEFIFAGWVIREKGVEELLQAWQQFVRDDPDYLLRIIGPFKPDYLSYLKTKYPTERVVFEGERSHEEVLSAMTEAAAFVLPSYTEGFPNAVVEAMGTGLPVAASRVGAIPEMLADDCGVLMDPASVSSCYQALKALASVDPAMGMRARAKANKEYSVSVVTDIYLRLWSDIAEK